MATRENVYPLPERHESDDYLDHFRFDRRGHEPQDPAYPRGQVTDRRRVMSYSLEGKQLPVQVSVWEIEVQDPFIEADPDGYKLVSSYVTQIEHQMLKQGYSPVDEGRHEATSSEEHNPFTRAWTAAPEVEGVRLWRDLVPTAEALEYLTHPYVGRMITNQRGESVPISKESALQMRFVDDAVAIRDRAVAMQSIAEEHLERFALSDEEIKWLSLASGTAEPAIAAAQAVKERHGLHVNLVLADLDSNALAHVEENARRYGFEDRVTTLRANIVSPKLTDKLAQATNDPDQQYDVVENMGFEEYLPQDGDKMGAFKGSKLPQASEFTKLAYSFVKPGGILISGNMVWPRPQSDYVFGIVDWPVINARSEEEILNVYKEAGILDDPNSKVDLFRVKSAQAGIHIYDIVRVTKLA
jgi:hypothetical protein